MAYDPTDAVTARGLLEDALALTSSPALTTVQVDRLFALAAEIGDSGTTYPVDALQRAVVQGWQIKAGLTADRYDLGGGTGKTLDESQWFDHCLRMASAYATGVMHVTGATRARGGIGSIRTITRPEEPGVPS